MERKDYSDCPNPELAEAWDAMVAAMVEQLEPVLAVVAQVMLSFITCIRGAVDQLMSWLRGEEVK